MQLQVPLQETLLRTKETSKRLTSSTRSTRFDQRYDSFVPRILTSNLRISSPTSIRSRLTSYLPLLLSLLNPPISTTMPNRLLSPGSPRRQNLPGLQRFRHNLSLFDQNYCCEKQVSFRQLLVSSTYPKSRLLALRLDVVSGHSGILSSNCGLRRRERGSWRGRCGISSNRDERLPFRFIDTHQQHCLFFVFDTLLLVISSFPSIAIHNRIVHLFSRLKSISNLLS
jgi:hypothetical protein